MSSLIIGITVDNRDNTAASGRYESTIAYSRAVADAGGIPVLLPHEPSLAHVYVGQCDAIILTGGVDPDTKSFGQPTHPKARSLDARRQAFELALLGACDRRQDQPVLGVCLGMQLMALHRGGRLHQYLPDVLDDPGKHQGSRLHPIIPLVSDSVLSPLQGHGSSAQWMVVSEHVQAVADPGKLRAIAAAPDNVIEAIDDPARPFYLGVQWHPERGDESAVNLGLFKQLVAACRKQASCGPNNRCDRPAVVG